MRPKSFGFEAGTRIEVGNATMWAVPLAAQGWTQRSVGADGFGVFEFSVVAAARDVM